MQHSNGYTGFTLVELMMVITIAGILLGMGIPAFGNYKANQQTFSTAESLVSALNFARSEAIKRRSTATIAPLTPNWSDGWTVATNGITLSNYGAAEGVTISASSPTAPIYNRDGRLSAAADISFSITVNSHSSASRCVKITLSGKPTTDSGGC